MERGEKRESVCLSFYLQCGLKLICAASSFYRSSYNRQDSPTSGRTEASVTGYRLS